MIIGNELCRAFEGLTINVDGVEVAVKSTFDDQYALEKFIKAYDKQGLDKFPLIFCVTGKNTGERPMKSKRKLIIMTKTDPNWLSKDRNYNTFEKVIQPIYNALIPLIESNKYLSVARSSKKRVEFTDTSNYGVTDGRVNKKGTADKSIILEYIDARIMELEIKYDDRCGVEYVNKII